MSQAIATLVGISAREAYLELKRSLQALIESDGACERLFNEQKRERDWREFSEEISRILS